MDFRASSRSRSLVALATFAAACSSDEEAPAPIAPPGPPELALLGLQPVGGPRWTPDDGGRCVELGQDPDQTVVVQVGKRARGDSTQLENWTLRSPFGCGAVLHCGYLQLTLSSEEDERRIVAITTSVPIAFARLRRPAGEHTLRIELRDHEGRPARVGDSGVPFLEEDLTFAVSCSPDSSPDAAILTDASAKEAGSAIDSGSLDSGNGATIGADASDSTTGDAPPLDGSTDASLNGDHDARQSTDAATDVRDAGLDGDASRLGDH